MLLPTYQTSAWISTGSDKAVAEEYAESIQGNLSECYVEAKAGELFAVHLGQSSFEVVAELFLDGEKQSSIHVPAYRGTCIKNKIVGPEAVQPFKFTDIKLTDVKLFCQPVRSILYPEGISHRTKILLALQKRWSRIWEPQAIQMKLYRVKKNRRRPSVPTTHFYKTDSEGRAFHERSKKAQLSSTTGFGDVQYAPPTKTASIDWIDNPKRNHPPFMTFKFHYRSGDLLEAEGKRRPSAPAPGTSRRSLSPKASTSSGRRTSSGGNDRKRTRDNGEDSELERLREENKRLRAAASQSGRVKPETDDDDIIEIKPKLKKTAPGQRPVQRKVIVLD